MKNTQIRALIVSLLAACSLPALANLTYSTGQDNNADGIDDVFKVNGAAAYLVTSQANGWPALPNAAITTGRYISFAADQSNATQGGIAGQRYDYTFQFNWTGVSHTTFDFRWVSDDYLTDIVLNGVSLGVNNLSAPAPWTISNNASGISGNLANGLNTIDFVIWNTGSNQPPFTGPSGPTGLAADFTIYGDATVGVPEPGSLALVGLGLIAALGARRRMTQRAV